MHACFVPVRRSVGPGLCSGPRTGGDVRPRRRCGLPGAVAGGARGRRHHRHALGQGAPACRPPALWPACTLCADQARASCPSTNALAQIRNRELVLQCCLERVPSSPTSAHLLLDYGLRLTADPPYAALPSPHQPAPASFSRPMASSGPTLAITGRGCTGPMTARPPRRCDAACWRTKTGSPRLRVRQAAPKPLGRSRAARVRTLVLTPPPKKKFMRRSSSSSPARHRAARGDMG